LKNGERQADQMDRVQDSWMAAVSSCRRLFVHRPSSSFNTSPSETPKPSLGSMKFLPVLREDGFLPRLAWAMMTFYVALRLPSLHHGLDFREMQKICISFISVAGGLWSLVSIPIPIPKLLALKISCEGGRDKNRFTIISSGGSFVAFSPSTTSSYASRGHKLR